VFNTTGPLVIVDVVSCGVTAPSLSNGTSPK
jgi:hypothetical protein